MIYLAKVGAWFRNLRSRRRVEEDVDAELQSYAAMLADEKERAGASPDEARRSALVDMGGMEAVKESVRDVRAGVSLERWLRDLRYAMRALRKAPGFTFSAAAALACGMAGTTAIFSVVDAVLLRPLPLNDPEKLVCVWEDNREAGWPQETPAPANYMDWRTRNRVFSDMGALSGVIFSVTGDGPPEQVEASYVTANLFPLLGAVPVLGRQIAPEEDRPGASRVVLISNGIWQRRFGGEPSAIGKNLYLDRVPHRIIGVMPRGFAFPDRSEVWVPIAFTAQRLAVRDSHYLRVFARLKDGVSVEEAQREMNRVALQLALEYPATNTKYAAVTSLKDQIVGTSRAGLLVLLGGSACLLLLTSINVAGLLLARGIVRSRELALRVAIGAHWRDLARNSVLEVAILSIAGCAFGWILARTSLAFLSRLVPPELGGWVQPGLDLHVATFSALAGIVVTLVAAILPVVAMSRVDPASLLQQGGRSNIGGRSGARRLLVIGQLAISVVLLIGTGLLFQTLRNLSRVELGFNPDNVLTARTSLPQSSESPYRDFARRETFYRQVLERVSAIPGVTAAGYTTFLPLTNGGGTSYFLVEGEAPPARADQNDANIRVITSNYLQTMGIRLLAGRHFDATDSPTSMPVALINKTMAQRFWRGRSPVGSRFKRNDPGAPWIAVVGVVADVRQNGIEQPGRPEMYFPATQNYAGGGWTAPRDLAIRVTGEPMQYAVAVRRAVWDVDPNQPVSAVMPLSELVASELTFRDTMMRLLGAFAALALLIAALGLYGSIAYSVSQRTREIGVRLALGALPKEVFWLTMQDGLRLTAVGVTIGLCLAWPLTGFAQSVLYGVSPFDPAAYGGAVAVLVVCGLLASAGPAFRAAVIDPMSALRLE